MRIPIALSVLAAAAGLAAASPAPAQIVAEAPAVRPDAIVDLATAAGVALVKGQWRYSDVKVVEVDHRSPGPDLKPSGPSNRTYDISPHAGGSTFDDSQWETLDPATLAARRSTGRLCFAWYRLNVTIPDRVGRFDASGATVVFEVTVDDYAEIWVDGGLPQVLGQTGGPLIKGFNAPNRVVIGRDVHPGQRIQLAVFALNGPVSDPPGNFIWIRSATLEFFRPGEIGRFQAVPTSVDRIDPGLDEILAPDTRIEKIAGGFVFTEGPVWIPDGYLLFSAPNENVIYRWTPDGQVSVFRAKSGYTGVDIGEFTQPGSNGLALDPEGRLTICEHGNRRVTRLEKNGTVTVIADRFEGKRLNSPNDLVYRSDGLLVFSDPPFGLPKFHDDPRRELPYTGVYTVYQGKIQLFSNDVTGPNGVAFSPDERYLYVTNWDDRKKVVMRYEMRRDGTRGDGSIFFDMTRAPGEEALDGLKVDQAGNLYVSGPGGVWILSPSGRHLGTLKGPELAANLAWGDADRRTLYLTARTGLYRVRVKIPGAGVAELAKR